MKNKTAFFPRQKPTYSFIENELRKARLEGSQITFKEDLKWIYPMVALAMHEHGMDSDEITEILEAAQRITAEWGSRPDGETAADYCERITGLTFEVK